MTDTSCVGRGRPTYDSKSDLRRDQTNSGIPAEDDKAGVSLDPVSETDYRHSVTQRSEIRG